MTQAEKSITIHSDDGITPAAPCGPITAGHLAVGRLVQPLFVRRLLGNALGIRHAIVLNRAIPHGLSRSDFPASMSGHSWCTTQRA